MADTPLLCRVCMQLILLAAAGAEGAGAEVSLAEAGAEAEIPLAADSAGGSDVGSDA